MRAWAAAAVAALGASTANAAGICKSAMGVQMGMGRCFGVNMSDCEADFEWDDEGFCSLQPYAMSKAVYDQWTAGTSLSDLCSAAGGSNAENMECMEVPMAQGLMDMISGMQEKRRAATQQNGTGGETPPPEPETPPPRPPPPSGPKLYSKQWCNSPAGQGMSVWGAMTWLSLLGCCGDSGEAMCYKPSVCGDPTKYTPNRVIGWDCEGLDSTSCSGVGFEWNGEGCETFSSASVTDAAATCTSAGGRPKNPKTCALQKATAEGWSPGPQRGQDHPLQWTKTGGSWSTDDCRVANRLVDAGCCGDGASICNTDPANVVLTTASVESALADVGMSAGAPVAGLEALGNLVSDPVVAQLATGAQELLFTFADAADVTEDHKASLAQSVADAVGVAVSRCTVSMVSRARKAVPLEVSLKVTIAPAAGGGGTLSPVVDVGTTSPAAAATGPFALATAAAAAFAAMC